MKYSVAWLVKVVSPYSQDKEQATQEIIFHILLTAASSSLFVVTIINVIALLVRQPFQSTSSVVPPLITFCMALFFGMLFQISKRGHYRIAAWTFLLFSLFLPAYVSVHWGVGIPQSLLTYALVIVMAAILLGGYQLILMTLGICVFIYIVTWCQQTGILMPDLAWRNQLPHLGNAIAYCVCLLLIALVAGLFDWQNRRALRRAQRSEALLRQERDQLQKIVYVKTQQLRQAQTDRLNELAKLAEFGTQASSFLHDIANPISIVALSLDELQKKREFKGFNEMKEVVREAIRANQKVEEYIASTRINLRKHSAYKKFSVYKEIELATKILDPRARQLAVSMEIVSPQKKLLLFGNKSRFHQVMSNIIGNAVDAYEAQPNRLDRRIIITIHEVSKEVVIEIQDYAGGINATVIDHIFEPFFSTKSGSPHLGIGLAICKQVVEQELQGTMACQSRWNEGTTFSFRFPR